MAMVETLSRIHVSSKTVSLMRCTNSFPHMRDHVYMNDHSAASLR